jgi:hypothetical protein
LALLRLVYFDQELIDVLDSFLKVKGMEFSPQQLANVT